MPSQREWVLLAYHLPREPSTPRIALWRRLRRLGALQLGDGLVTLPADSRTREQLEWLGDEIHEAGGEATIWLAKPGTAEQERALATRMTNAIAKEYAEVTKSARAAARRPASERRRSLSRLRRTLRAIRARDYFSSEEAERASRAVEDLALAVEVAA
jgi:hypothetical protein